MSWFWIALAATLAWGGADLFYKLGANESDRYSHLKTSVFVGLCFGLHAAFTLIFGDIGFDWRNIYRYLPVAAWASSGWACLKSASATRTASLPRPSASTMWALWPF